MTLIRVVGFNVSLIVFLVTTAASGDKPYIYISNGNPTQAIATEDRYMIKISSANSPDYVTSALADLGYANRSAVYYSAGETLLVVTSSLKAAGSLDVLRSIPGVRFAMPVFRTVSGIEYSVGNRIVVVLKEGMPENELMRLNASHNNRIVYRDPYSLAGGRFVIAASWDSKMNVFDVADEYRRCNSVLFAAPSFCVFYPWHSGGEPEDDYYGDQWYLDKIKALDAWNFTYGSSSIKIAVLDVGIDLLHDDLDGQLVQGYDAVDDDDDPPPGERLPVMRTAPSVPE